MDAIFAALQGPATVAALACGVALLVWASLHAMLAAHELGHAIAAWVMGYPVRLVEVGAGYRLFQTTLGVTLIRWRLTPSRGVTFLYRPFRLRRRARIPFVLGGCVANVVAIICLFLAMDGASEQTRGYLLFFIVGQFLGLFELFAIRPSRLTGLTPDGGALLSAFGARQGWDRELVKAYSAGVRRDYRSAGPERATSLSAVVLHAAHVGGPDRNPDGTTPQALGDRNLSRRLQTTLLGRKALTPAERATLLDSLITGDLLIGSGDLSDLDQWSAELLALLPDDPNANASRGAVLAMLGRPEAKRHLEMEFGPNAGPFALSLRHAFLARALLNEGDVAAAREEIEKSKGRWAEMKISLTLPVIVAMEEEMAREGDR